jgi:hypothetical protein
MNDAHSLSLIKEICRSMQVTHLHSGNEDDLELNNDVKISNYTSMTQ